MPPEQAEETSVDPGKAEPGRDIFAPHPQANNIKSEAMGNPVVDDEPKAISSVGAAPSGEDIQKHDNEKIAETPGGEPSLAATTENSSSSSSSDAKAAESAAPSPEVKAKVQGPLDAEQAEADEVRQELFPHANDS